jgi:hypothetical protein
MKQTIAKFLPRTFNDFLCLFILSVIFAMWIMDGLKKIELNSEVMTASIIFFTLIGQFYFRKAKNETEGNKL